MHGALSGASKPLFDVMQLRPVASFHPRWLLVSNRS